MSILKIEGLKTMTKESQGKINGGGPDRCYSYWTFFAGDVYCCGGGWHAECTSY